jgi:hypothetical protein
MQHLADVHPRLAWQAVVLLSALLALAAMALWLALSFALAGIEPARYRDVAIEAARSGTLAEVYRLPFAPGKEFYTHG